VCAIKLSQTRWLGNGLEQIRSQCTYDQQRWHTKNTRGGLTL